MDLIIYIFPVILLFSFGLMLLFKVEIDLLEFVKESAITSIPKNIEARSI